MLIGFEDVTVSYAHTARAPLEETITLAEGQVFGKGHRACRRAQRREFHRRQSRVMTRPHANAGLSLK